MRPTTMVHLLVLQLLMLPGCKDTPEEFTQDDDTTPLTDDDHVGDDDSAPASPVAVASADVSEGTIPLVVTLSAAGSEAVAGVAALDWDLGDGEEASGEEVVHTYLGSGEIVATVTVTDLLGATASASASLTVGAASCPTMAEGVLVGTVASDQITEVSGVVESRKNPGVLWVHNDSGDTPRLFALTPEGTHLGTFTLLDAPGSDWEDLSIGLDPDSGESVLYVGDVGDNGHGRDHVRVHLVPEPDVSPDQEPVEVDVSGTTVLLDYPEEAAFDCETLLVDPANGDIYLVTKTGEGPAQVYRKAAPHVDEERAEMELVADLAAGEVLASGVTTGGDFSPMGDRLVVRGYGPVARLWLRDRAVPLADTLASAPCEIFLPLELQAEALGFSTDGAGIYTIPEGADAGIHYTAFLDETAEAETP